MCMCITAMGQTLQCLQHCFLLPCVTAATESTNSVNLYIKKKRNKAAFTSVQHSSLYEQPDHNTRASCCFIRCLNKELIIAAELALYESSRTHHVLDKLMNHRQLGLGTATTESTGKPTEMFVFMRSYSTSVSSKKTISISPAEGNNRFV